MKIGLISDLDSEGDETLLASEGTSSLSADVIPNEEASFSGMHACLHICTALVLCIFLYHCFEVLTKKRIICSSHKLIELFGKVCQEEGCGEEYHLTNTIVGCCLTISARCSNGYFHKWSSSERITNNNGNMFLDNLDFVTALVLSGKHFNKIQQFGQFFEMAVLSRSSFYSNQRLYICPAINNFLRSSRYKYIPNTIKSNMFLLG